jgi:hypothetical protein
MHGIFEALFDSLFNLSSEDESTDESTGESTDGNAIVRTKGNSFQDFTVVSSSKYTEDFEVCFDKVQADEITFEEF